MPRPLSAISKIAKPSLVRPRTVISPGTPGLRYLSALSIRLEKICSSARRSLTISGSGSIRICGLGLGGLMRHGRDDAFDQFARVDPDRLEFAPALAGEVEDRR